MKALKSIALVAIALLYIQATPPSNSNSEGISFFQGTWEEALAKAEEENKVIFLDAYVLQFQLHQCGHGYGKRRRS